MAICEGTAVGVILCIMLIIGVIRHKIVNIIVPKTLNMMCIKVVLLAFVVVPIEARRAVIHVPIFCPKSIKAALLSPITPLEASA